MYVENASRLVPDTLVEDVEVARHRERDDAVFLGPCVDDLLVGDTRAERPSDLRLLRLNIPWSECEHPFALMEEDTYRASLCDLLRK